MNFSEITFGVKQKRKGGMKVVRLGHGWKFNLVRQGNCCMVSREWRGNYQNVYINGKLAFDLSMMSVMEFQKWLVLAAEERGLKVEISSVSPDLSEMVLRLFKPVQLIIKTKVVPGEPPQLRLLKGGRG